MNRIKNIFLLALFVNTFSSCIEQFHPGIEDTITPKYVVDGRITDQEGYQSVSVSMTSSFNNPNFVPLTLCKVKITDNNGKVFNLSESIGGVYRVWMGKQSLIHGNSYQVNILTPTGIEIVSDFDQMPECPDIDSIYYVRKDYPTTNPSINREGIQFYIDIDRKNTNSHFYRWEIEETWEHHASSPITWFSSGSGEELSNPPDYSRFVCWTTSMMNDVFTLSTEKIVQNTYKMKALHFVDNQTQRLTYGYSALVYQIALSEPAYLFWDKLRFNGNSEGGFTSSQPFSVKGNLRCSTNPELEILGFFSASSIKSKRIFVRNIPNFNVYRPQCIPPRLPLPKEKYKYFDYINGVKYVVDNACVECDYAGGKTYKPSFWPYDIVYD